MCSKYYSLALLLLGSLAAGAVMAVPVDGFCNPNLAGRADGYECCNDIAPTHSPVEVTPEISGVTVTPGTALTFSAEGAVSHNGGSTGGNNPDGAVTLHMTNFGDGISAPNWVRLNALMGVFLGGVDPTGSATPARISYVDGLGFASILPRTGQIFFIGDGLTSDSALGETDGVIQVFQVPDGASRLFLGTSDGSGWNNNTGSFTVEVTQVSALDADADGVVDAFDNCTEVMNVLQHDSNDDGIGNSCDPDIVGTDGDPATNNCLVDFFDVGALKTAFLTNPASPNWNPDADFDDDDFIGFLDVAVMKDFFLAAPGPAPNPNASSGCLS
ncbi:MAG: hypothetical protein OEQ74_10905 [Gammaproteobacteria bacterium]|nr:hypothetical protein [Gammaproteobacteria bacterium]